MEGDVPSKKCSFKPVISGVVLKNPKPWGAKEEEEEEVGVNIAQQPFERLWVCQKIHTFASYAVLPTLAPCDPPRIKGQKSPKLIVSNWGLKSHL